MRVPRLRELPCTQLPPSTSLRVVRRKVWEPVGSLYHSSCPAEAPTLLKIYVPVHKGAVNYKTKGSANTHSRREVMGRSCGPGVWD